MEFAIIVARVRGGKVSKKSDEKYANRKLSKAKKELERLNNLPESEKDAPWKDRYKHSRLDYINNFLRLIKKLELSSTWKMVNPGNPPRYFHNKAGEVQALSVEEESFSYFAMHMRKFSLGGDDAQLSKILDAIKIEFPKDENVIYLECIERMSLLYSKYADGHLSTFNQVLALPNEGIGESIIVWDWHFAKLWNYAEGSHSDLDKMKFMGEIESVNGKKQYLVAAQNRILDEFRILIHIAEVVHFIMGNDSTAVSCSNDQHCTIDTTSERYLMVCR